MPANQTDVFRFVSQRVVQLAPDTDLKRKLILAYDPPSGMKASLPPPQQRMSREQAVTWATDFIESSAFVPNLISIETAIAALDRWLLSQGNRPAPKLIQDQVKEITKQEVTQLVRSAAYIADRARVTSSLVALTTIPQGRERAREELLRAMYIFGLLEQLANDPNNLKTADDVHDLLVNGIVVLPPNFPVPAEALARIPAIGDLKVVRQELLRYEMGEAAHIESVLKGESKERTHRSATTREEINTVESERIEEREQDLQSTERFEMQKEASSIISEETQLQAGVTVTASYGPTASMTANLGFAANYSKEESSRVASVYARDITQRSSSRVQERLHQTRTTRLITEIEETNKHTINNATGSDHINGIYRWVDKVYRAQVFNYGKRLLLEFIVPEPAAFYRHVIDGQTAPGITMSAPDLPVAPGVSPPRPLSPADISATNYMDVVKKYPGANVTPPPPPDQTISLAWDEPYPGPNTPIDSATPAFLKHKAKREVKVPDGYQAVEFTATIMAEAWKSDVQLSVGRTVKVGSTTSGQPGGAAVPLQITSALTNETGDLPVTLRIWNTWGYSISIVVKCHYMPEYFAKWQLATYEAIMRAYFDLKSQYDEQVAAAETRRGIDFDGRNPTENRLIERGELKKNVISMLERQHFNQPPVDDDAIEVTLPEKYPEVNFDVASAERDFIQWFEQAFEWEQITYLFYPYFWGRKDGWVRETQRNVSDPLFSAFLKAGAARVLVPVRPGFERAMVLYLATGIIWNGSQVPQVSDPLYVSIVNEIQDQQKADAKGVPDGDPWEVRMPTTLVMLQKDANLPSLSQ